MSKEQKPKRLSIGETNRRIVHLAFDSRGIKFGDPLHALIDETIRLKEQEQKQADNKTDAHKTAEALARIEAKIDTNTAITRDLVEELETWREWVQKLATDKKNTTPAPKLCAPIQAAIVELWETFNAQPADCEDTTEPSGWRKHRRTYNECLAIHGNDDIWHGRKLIDLTPSAKDLERVIHNAKEKKRKKPAAASAPQTRRKK